MSQVKFNCEVQPGISSYAADPQAAAAALNQDCLPKAVAQIPADRRASAMIHLRATAGMRVLNDNNATQAQAVLQACLQLFRNSGLGGSITAEILPGELEGAFGWITANYLDGTLGFRVGKVPTLGAMDLGGASTQITFQVPPNTPLQPQDSYPLSVFNLRETLYTHSYLCYGANMATARIQARLMAENFTAQPPAVVVNPCVPTGWNVNFTAAAINALAADYCTNDTGLPTGVTTNVTIEGGSNATACAEQARWLVTSNKPPAMGTNQPPVGGIQFLAFSGYHYVIDYLCGQRKVAGCIPAGNDTGGWKISPGNLSAAADLICNENLTTLQQATPGVASKLLSGYCFSARYIAAILTTGYGFTDDSLAVSFVDQVKDRDVGWTLGYILDYTTKAAAVRRTPLVGDDGLAGGLVGGIVLLAAAALVYHRFYYKRRNTRFYSELKD